MKLFRNLKDSTTASGRSIPVDCTGCGRRSLLANVYADLEDTPGTFYCLPCARPYLARAEAVQDGDVWLIPEE